jgi:hypothetical protein
MGKRLRRANVSKATQPDSKTPASKISPVARNPREGRCFARDFILAG